VKRSLLLVVAVFFAAITTASATDAMRSLNDLTDAIGRARQISVTSYWLPSDNPIVGALHRACARGANVSIVLADPGYDPRVATDNLATVNQFASLRGNCTATTVERPLHMKSVTTDGVVWLSDTNFTPRGFLLVSNDPTIDRTVSDTIRDDAPHATSSFATGKAMALHLESSLIAGSTGPVCVSTEAFSDSAQGVNTPISATLFAALAQHRPVFLAVSPYEMNDTERELLTRFHDAGGRYAVRNADEKFAMVGSGPAWIGSANATTIAPPYGTQLDWGLVTSDGNVIGDIAERCKQLAAAAR
jgi:hypothetical protein